jgi:hypothetical protein
MDQITIKTPKPSMSSLLVFNRVYSLEIQSVMLVFFRPLLCTSATLTFSLVHLSPPLSRVNNYRGMFSYRVSQGWGGWDWVVWIAYTGVIHYVFVDQIPNLQNSFTTPNKT